MSARFEAESSLTDRYQTTVPEGVRRALKLGKRDKIHYSVRESGEVVLSRVQPKEEEDPALGAFLAFLAQDITLHPEHVQPLDPALVASIQKLVDGVAVDLDAPLSPDDE